MRPDRVRGEAYGEYLLWCAVGAPCAAVVVAFAAVATLSQSGSGPVAAVSSGFAGTAATPGNLLVAHRVDHGYGHRADPRPDHRRPAVPRPSFIFAGGYWELPARPAYSGRTRHVLSTLHLRRRAVPVGVDSGARRKTPRLAVPGAIALVFVSLGCSSTSCTTSLTRSSSTRHDVRGQFHRARSSSHVFPTAPTGGKHVVHPAGRWHCPSPSGYLQTVHTNGSWTRPRP